MVIIKTTKNHSYLGTTIPEGTVLDARTDQERGRDIYVVDYKGHERHIYFENAEVINEPKTSRPESEHYHTGNVDVWTFADENFELAEVTGFHRIDAIKYLARYGKKKGWNRVDLEKARAEIDKLLELHDKHRK